MEGGAYKVSELIIPIKNDTSRKIIHIDMDAFYASIEERDHPEYQGKPIVIARHPKETKGKGVVSTANYEARKFGIHSAMSAKEAYEKCPHALFVSGSMSYYKEVSTQIRSIFKRYTDMIEPLSLDEAYLDVTENKINCKSALKIASMIQRDIWQELHLTCSAGVSYNKFLAKLASDYEKPRGQTLILPEDAVAFLRELPIASFYGVGKKTVEKMYQLGIYTGDDLLKQSEMDLIHYFGKMGYSLYRKVRGIHNAPVEAHRERKSVGRERTYTNILREEDEVVMQLRKMSKDVSNNLKKIQKHGSTVVLKVRTPDYVTRTKQISLRIFVNNEEEIFSYAYDIWQEMMASSEQIEVRLLGISLTNLKPNTYENIVLPI